MASRTDNANAELLLDQFAKRASKESEKFYKLSERFLELSEKIQDIRIKRYWDREYDKTYFPAPREESW